MAKTRQTCAAAAALASILSTIGPLNAQPATLRGQDAFGDWQGDKPGSVRLTKPEDRPKPGATPSAANMSGVVARPAATKPQVPTGFQVELFADGLSGPRIIRTAPNGDLFVAETRAGRIRILRAADGASKPQTREIFASGLNDPFGIAFFPNGNDPRWVYVANTDSIVRFPYRSGDLQASGKPETVVAKLPTGGHSARDIAFTPKGQPMLGSVGSEGNDGEGMGRPPGGLEVCSPPHPLAPTSAYPTIPPALLPFHPPPTNPTILPP